MTRFFVGFFITICVSAVATARGFSYGVSAGYPQSQIINPDGSNAYYNGVAVLGQLQIPVFENMNSGVYVTANLRYLGLENTANSSAQMETANHLSKGAGLKFRFMRANLGATYHLVTARHYLIGETNQNLKFDFNVLDYYIEWEWDVARNANFAVSYHIGSGVISKSDTLLSKDSKYSDSIIWIHFRLNTSKSFSEVVRRVFR